MFFFLLFLLSVLLIVILVLATITTYIKRRYNRLYENFMAASMTKYRGRTKYDLDNKCKIINSPIYRLGGKNRFYI